MFCLWSLERDGDLLGVEEDMSVYGDEQLLSPVEGLELVNRILVWVVQPFSHILAASQKAT
jgi:hypothetical protein